MSATIDVALGAPALVSDHDRLDISYKLGTIPTTNHIEHLHGSPDEYVMRCINTVDWFAKKDRLFGLSFAIAGDVLRRSISFHSSNASNLQAIASLFKPAHIKDMYDWSHLPPEDQFRRVAASREFLARMGIVHACHDNSAPTGPRIRLAATAHTFHIRGRIIDRFVFAGAGEEIIKRTQSPAYQPYSEPGIARLLAMHVLDPAYIPRA